MRAPTRPAAKRAISSSIMRAASIMREQGTRAHIVNTASIAGLLSGVPFIGPYCATKVAVVSISETAATEFTIDGTDPHLLPDLAAAIDLQPADEVPPNVVRHDSRPPSSRRTNQQ